MKKKKLEVKTCLLLVVLLLIPCTIFVRIPLIQAQDSQLVLSEDFESGWGSWLDYSTQLAPTHTISVNQSNSGAHSLWGTYGINGQSSIYKYFTPITSDMLFTFWSYTPNQTTTYSFEQRIKISSSNAAGGIYLRLDNYDNNPKIELDWQGGYNLTSISSSFSYNSWNNITLYLHYSNGYGNGYAKLWFNNELIFSQTALNDYNYGDYAPSLIMVIIDDGSAIGSYIDDISLYSIGTPTPDPISTPTPRPTESPTTSPTPTATATPTPTNSNTPTPTSIPTPTTITFPTPTPIETSSPTPFPNPSSKANDTPIDESEIGSMIPIEYIVASSIVGISALSILTIYLFKKK